MEEIFINIDTFINDLLLSLGVYGPILGCLLILVESILPILPLSVFITLNFMSFGHVAGFIISYILTVIGCNLAFYLCKRSMKGRFEYLLKKFDKNKLLKIVANFSNIKMSNLVALLAFPFTPAFAINIFSGISDMKHKKFLVATLIAKPFMVYFWGYLGVTLIDSLTHPTYLIKVIILVVVAYVASRFVSKKFEVE